MTFTFYSTPCSAQKQLKNISIQFHLEDSLLSASYSIDDLRSKGVLTSNPIFGMHRPHLISKLFFELTNKNVGIPVKDISGLRMLVNLKFGLFGRKKIYVLNDGSIIYKGIRYLDEKELLWLMINTINSCVKSELCDLLGLPQEIKFR